MREWEEDPRVDMPRLLVGMACHADERPKWQCVSVQCERPEQAVAKQTVAKGHAPFSLNLDRPRPSKCKNCGVTGELAMLHLSPDEGSDRRADRRTSRTAAVGRRVAL